MTATSTSGPITSLDPSTASICAQLQSLWVPPSRLPLSQWVRSNIVLSSEYSARSSFFHPYKWQEEPLDAVTDPATYEVVICSGVQMMKSLIIQCAIAYVVAEDPGPILLLEPKEDSCLAFSKRRLTPMIRDCPCLQGKMSKATSSVVGSTLLSKEFPGGNLLIVSANTPVDVAQHTIRYVYCDEPDKYPSSAGKEGDPMDLAWERAATFQTRRRRILACSPTIQGLSRIGKAYRASDMRKPWVPCWKCGQYQILSFFPDAGGMGGVRFDTSISRERQPDSAYYQCKFCDAHWSDSQRLTACNKTEWRAERPFEGVAGFWINHLYSPWKKLSDIVKHFLRVKDDRQQYQVFINTVLGIEWAEDGETPDNEILYARRESYPYGLESAVVPQRALFLTAAVDVQDSPPRLEVEVKAWGRGRENWSICYEVLQVFAQNGQLLPVTSVELWDKLNTDVLQRSWTHESGHTLSILALAIDTGSRPKPVYDFARKHPQLSYSPGTGLRLHAVRTVIPVKGTPDQLRIVSSVSKEDAARRRQGVRIIGFGAHCAKQEIYDALKHIRPKPDGSLSGAAVPGACHFPMYDMVYFEMLCSEVRIVKDDGKVVYEQRNPRNESLDTFCMNRAAAACAGIDRFNETQWRQLEAAVGRTEAAPVLHGFEDARTMLSSDRVPTQSQSAQSGEGAVDVSSPSSTPSPDPYKPTTLPTPATSGQQTPQTPRPTTYPVRPVRGRFA